MEWLRRHVLLGIGWLALGLGLLGVVLPLLPTVPFVLLAAACFLRSSERLHGWLVGHPVLGCHIRNYRAGKGVSGRAKLLATLSLWASILTSTLLVVPLLWIDLALVMMGAAVTAYLLRLPTCGAEQA